GNGDDARARDPLPLIGRRRVAPRLDRGDRDRRERLVTRQERHLDDLTGRRDAHLELHHLLLALLASGLGVGRRQVARQRACGDVLGVDLLDRIGDLLLDERRWWRWRRRRRRG